MTSVIERPKIIVTAEELFSMLPEEHFELIRGELKEKNMPTGDEHGNLTFALTIEIGQFVRANRLGRCWTAETGFFLSRDPDTVLAPDFAFVRTENLPETVSRGYVRVIPDLVLETRSPSDRRKPVQDKVAEWLNAGVSIVLELDPAKQILSVYRKDKEVKKLGVDEIFDGEEILPGFTLPLHKLFEG